ncbi:MAG: zinc ribbon domain-containing protein [Parvularculaceae bacterium]|nr:zinc ribbon domain-containing protein [Parvularculaceae bacterium]
MSAKSYKNCQSCGMPLKRDEKGGGTNADGSKSVEFCSHCYQAGAFTQPHITAAEMQALVTGKLKEMGFPGFMAGMFSRNVPKL